MPSGKLLGEKEAGLLASRLSESYKDAHYYLNFKTPVDLVVAAILSAQTRDEVVNKITPALFAKYNTAKDYAGTDLDTLIGYIKSVSFAGNKAKNIIATCKAISERYGGKVPDRMDELVELPGIGRKTANTILINAYGIVEGIPVDTWVIKLSYRLGLSLNTDPDKIEADLKSRVPKKYWKTFAYVMKTHGKTICQAIPYCSKCPIERLCPKNGVAKRL
ncbi:MAG: endonuclease III [Candidatus Micrarchaeaceae archaeon]|jgi:endonuclease-3|nr:endonuclease III [Candidatus Micrarchaeota archaeon]